LDMNRLSAAIMPASFSISFRVRGGYNCSMASTFFEFASISQDETI
jgi:hypothetical protein